MFFSNDPLKSLLMIANNAQTSNVHNVFYKDSDLHSGFFYFKFFLGDDLLYTWKLNIYKNVVYFGSIYWI